MKKFLLLIVGVLFALSANAKWTLYVDISKTGWTDAPYIYCGKWEAPNDPNLAYNWESIFHNRYQMTKVAENIYKWEADVWDGLSTIFFAKDASLTNPSNTKFYDETYGYSKNMNGTDAYGRITNKSGDNWALVNYRCYTLESGKNDIVSVVDNFFPASEKYSLRGNFTQNEMGGSNTWDNNNYAFEKQPDGSFVFDLSEKITTLKSGTKFKIYDYANDHNLWAGQGKGTISKGADYALSYGDDIEVAEDISNPVFTLTYTNGNLTLKITEKEGTTDPDPDPTAYTIYFDAARSSWSKVELTGATATASVAENGLNKFEFSTSGNVYFSDGDATQIIVNPLTNGHVYYVQNSELKDGGEYASYKPLAQWEIRLSGQFCGWSTPGADNTTAPLFTYQGGTTFILYLNSTLLSGEGFKVYDVTGKSGDSEWGTGYGSTNGKLIELNQRYSLTQTNAKDKNITPNDNIVRPLLTLDVSTWTLTITNPGLEFTYAIHGNIITGSTADYTMNKMEGSNYWCFEGYLKDGWFGIKKLQNGEQYKKDGHNEWGWIHSLENAAITLGTWNKAVVKGYYPDNNPNYQGTGDWVLSNLAEGTKYTIMFDVENMQILVSNVAASGVEDINVDEDAPVEYFNLQGQRVNGELTPGIYIRRQGSTVTKVRF